MMTSDAYQTFKPSARPGQLHTAAKEMKEKIGAAVVQVSKPV